MDELPVGMYVQVGMTFTSCGWQSATTAAHNAGTTIPWLSHFAYTVLQLPNVTAVMYGRGVGHVPANTGYTTGLLIWWKGPHGQVMFEEV
ncbi:MAG: hypothetical protein ACKPKO_06880, partial [Candidatus Fonsibacter sp.]